MCGICGLSHSTNQIPERALLEKMNAAIAHRGPDSDGFYTEAGVGLAMRRLAIIDVSGGDQPNTVSLGLFKDQENARKRRAEVTAAGFPARITERTESAPQYWLDLVAEGSGIDWRSRIRSDGVGSHSTSCF